MSNKQRKISKKQAKKVFNTVGLFLIIYVLLVMLIPSILYEFLLTTDSTILDDKTLYFGIYFIIILFGTILPFFIMRKIFKLPFKKMNRHFSATFADLFVQTIVFFTICIGLTYVSNNLFSYLGMEGKLICSIGLNYEQDNLKNALYVFMLIVVTPLVEEYAFRGVLLNILGRYGKLFGLYAASIIFAFAHTNFAEMIPALAMGYYLGKTSLRYRSIIPTIFIHILFNGLIYALCVLPLSVTRYMSYVLVLIIAAAVYLYVSGRYERIVIQKTNSEKLTLAIFFNRPTVIIAILLMIADTVMFMLRT